MSSKRTRREFLEQSMFATAAAMAVGSGTSVVAQQAAAPARRIIGANDTINVAVVGVNGRGQSHIGAYAANKTMNTMITHICDTDSTVGEQRSMEVGKRQGGVTPKYVQDLRRVLDDPSVDAVSIATPNHWHSLAAIWAMQAGKDVYVEKPISHNVSEGRRVVEASTKLNRICQTGTQGRSSPGNLEVMAFIRGGGIGDVLVSRGLCYKRRDSIGPAGVYQPPGGVNYDVYCGPAPMDPLTRKRFHYDWHWQWAMGNGDLGNQGIHQMDVARWALGINRLPDAVISYGGRMGYVDAGEVANTQVVVMPYGKQALVFEVRGLPTPVYKGAAVGNIIEGTEGYVVIGGGGGPAVFDKSGKPTGKTFGGGGGDGENNHFANFISAMRSRRRSDLRADCFEGHLSSACCHLGNISYRLGEQVTPAALVSRLGTLKVADNVQDTFERTRTHLTDNDVDIANTKLTMGTWLTLDPTTERFIDNDKANAMLTRPYRAPYIVPVNKAAI